MKEPIASQETLPCRQPLPTDQDYIYTVSPTTGDARKLVFFLRWVHYHATRPLHRGGGTCLTDPTQVLRQFLLFASKHTAGQWQCNDLALDVLYSKNAFSLPQSYHAQAVSPSVLPLKPSADIPVTNIPYPHSPKKTLAENPRAHSWFSIGLCCLLGIQLHANGHIWVSFPRVLTRISLQRKLTCSLGPFL